jgi:hypothetical protein
MRPREGYSQLLVRKFRFANSRGVRETIYIICRNECLGGILCLYQNYFKLDRAERQIHESVRGLSEETQLRVYTSIYKQKLSP